MRRNTSIKKLSLNVTTVRSLSTAHLAGIAGGATHTCITYKLGCKSVVDCPTLDACNPTITK